MTALNSATTHRSINDAELEALMSDEQSLFEDEEIEVVASEHEEVSDEELSSIFADSEPTVDDELAAAFADLPEEESVHQSGAGLDEDDDEVGVVADEAPVVEKKAKPKKEPTPSTAGLKPDAAIRTKLGEKVYDVLVVDDQTMERSDVDALLKRADSLPKKVGEKVANIAYHLANGVRLSCYTETAIKLLKEHGEITLKDIKQAYLEHPYSPGTANAQSSQMKQVLPFLGLATLEGDRLTKNEDSILLGMLAN